MRRQARRRIEGARGDPPGRGRWTPAEHSQVRPRAARHGRPRPSWQLQPERLRILEGLRRGSLERAGQRRHQQRQRHVARLESRPATTGGNGITMRDLVISSLRMRPDRLIVGEVRGPEALDMLQAMNTGHDGSMTTLHANKPRDALARIETLVLMAGFDLPVRAIRAQIVSAINVIVHLERFPDGSRKVTQISELVGMEDDTITMQDVFRFARSGHDANGRVTGRFVATGIRPRILERMQEIGLEVPPEIQPLFPG